MPLPPVVVEIVAVDVRPELRDALLDACSRAVEGAVCVSSSDEEPEVPPTAVAIVSWQSPGQVRIQVGLRHSRKWRVRHLEFSEVDVPVERWRAAGFATGTLAGKLSEAAESEVEPLRSRPLPATFAPRTLPGAPAEPAPPGDPSTRGQPSSSAVFLDALGLVGNGLQDGPWRLGGRLRASFASGLPGGFASLGFGHTGSGSDAWGVAVSFTEGELGGGALWSLSGEALWLQLRGEAVLGRARLRAEDGQTGAVDESERWLRGIRAGGDLVWMPVPSVGAFFGVEAGWLTPELEVRLRSRPHTTLPSLQLAGVLGLRYRP